MIGRMRGAASGIFKTQLEVLKIEKMRRKEGRREENVGLRRGSRMERGARRWFVVEGEGLLGQADARGHRLPRPRWAWRRCDGEHHVRRGWASSRGFSSESSNSPQCFVTKASNAPLNDSSIKISSRAPTTSSNWRSACARGRVKRNK